MFSQIVSYALHLVVALALFFTFMALYFKLTPYDEIEQIRTGNVAAALSSGGALLGFCLTLASSLSHNDSLEKFVVWALIAMVVQVLAFLLVGRLLRRAAVHIAANNIAMGAFVGFFSLVVGLINAACLT